MRDDSKRASSGRRRFSASKATEIVLDDVVRGIGGGEVGLARSQLEDGHEVADEPAELRPVALRNTEELAG